MPLLHIIARCVQKRGLYLLLYVLRVEVLWQISGLSKKKKSECFDNDSKQNGNCVKVFLRNIAVAKVQQE